MLQVRIRILLALALAFVLALVFYLRSDARQDGSAGQTSIDKVGEQEGAGVEPRSKSAPDSDMRSGAGEETPRLPAGLAPQRRATLLEALEKARGARQRPVSSGKIAGAKDAPEPLSIENQTGSTSAWESQQLATLNELLGECHSLARAEVGELMGTIGIRFTLAGEPEIGGLLDEVEFLEDYSTIDNATMRECMRESLYALELDPPPDGVAVGREITLRFDDDE